ncbi:MAG TPA: alpha-L-arabinofuranosidase C-terminal domain-containing protein [Blastocatellia bacterium]|nr:alpha-L-arabinofuranosidase C-terminal domain-containing protein [Blastocatellia bacterium]
MSLKHPTGQDANLKNTTTISRRGFAKGMTTALIAVPFSIRAQQGTLRARIKIDTERMIGEIDPKIYGNFIEHLGRCIDGGVFEDGSPLSDGNGFRRDVMEAVKKLNVTQLRWPGGNFVSNYHWMDGIGPRDKRPPRLEMAWGTVESNQFGTHEFLQYAELMKTEPYICVNLGTGTWTEAQQWVEYVNSSQDTAMTRLRKQNGRQEPWKVTYWGLGNEIDGPWQMGHKSVDDYGKFALEAAKLMKWTDPNIKLIAAGSSNYNTGIDWIGWNRATLEYLKTHIDYLSLHMYVGNRDNDYDEFLTSSIDLDGRIKTTEGVINAAISGMPRNRRIYIAWDEWNVWYRARGAQQRGRRILEERYNLEDALVVATFLNSFVNHAHIIKMANMAQLVNVIAPIFTSDKGIFLQTIYYPLQLFANNTKGTALELFTDGPKYESKRFGPTPYLSTSAGYDDGTLVLNVVNRHRDRPIEVEFEAQDKQFAGPVEVAEVNGPDIKAENDFGVTKVKAVTSSTRAEGRKLRHSFPAHSYTMLRAKLV